MTELIALTEEERSDALERFRLIQPFLERMVSLPQLSKQVSVPLRTLERWIHNYRKYGLTGLTRKRGKGSGQRHTRFEIQYLIQGLVLQKSPPSVASIHRKIESVCRAYGWQIPSYGTVINIISDIDKGLLTLAQEGTKAYEDAFDLLHQRDATSPNEIWQADHSPLPIFVLDERGESQRPWLTVIEDDYSRTIAGFNITFRAPCAINTSLALRQAIWRKSDPRWHICGIPESFYTDHGSDFTSRHMEQVAAQLHIELIFSLVGKPQGRGRVERFFRTVEQLLLLELPGFAPDGHPVNPPKLTLSAFTDIFREWLLGTYHQRTHGGTGQLPQAMWEANGFLPALPEDLTDLDLLLTFSATRIVNQEGIRFNKYWYKDLTLSAYVGEEVTIRYDPDDIAELRVYYKEQFLCRAVCFELAGATMSLKDVIRARNRRKRELRQIIQERRDLVEIYLKAHQGYLDPTISPDPESAVPKPPNAEAAPKKPKLKRYFNE